ncbi:MAG: HMA2 domain-containing protein [Desulfomonilaceae bacterium]
MTDLNTLLIQWGLKVRLLHKLPGRLRVEISMLRKIPVEKRELIEKVIGRVALPSGIKSLDLSFISGSVLLKYDAHIITEQGVLATIRELVNTVVYHREALRGIGNENLPAVIEKLNGVVEKANYKTVEPYEGDAISEDVWH